MARSRYFYAQDDGSPWPVLVARAGRRPNMDHVIHGQALADLLGVHPNTVSRWRARRPNGLPCEEWRNLTLYYLPEVDAWRGGA